MNLGSSLEIFPSVNPLACKVFSDTLGTCCLNTNGVNFRGLLRRPPPRPGPQQSICSIKSTNIRMTVYDDARCTPLNTILSMLLYIHRGVCCPGDNREKAYSTWMAKWKEIHVWFLLGEDLAPGYWVRSSSLFCCSRSKKGDKKKQRKTTEHLSRGSWPISIMGPAY